MSEDVSYQIEMQANGVLLVRIPSKPFNGYPLPDAVFTFRVQDPQYELWIGRYQRQQEVVTRSVSKKQ